MTYFATLFHKICCLLIGVAHSLKVKLASHNNVDIIYWLLKFGV